MKKSSLFLTLFFIAPTPQCHAMDDAQKNNQPNILATITGVSYPLCVVPLLNNTVAISGENALSLWNLSTNTESRRLSNSLVRYIATNQQKELLAAITTDTLTIYDLKTYTSTCFFIQTTHTGAPAFNRAGDTVCIYNILTGMESFKNNSIQTTPLRAAHRSSVAFNPTKEEMVYCADDEVTVIALENQVFSTQYSHDGSFIAINTTIGCIIIDPATASRTYLSDEKNYEVSGMTFHPDSSSIFATLSSDRDWIQCWHIPTKKPIAAIQLPGSAFFNSTFLNPTNQERITFSLDKERNIIVTHFNKCLVIQTPFEVINNDAYERGTQNKLFSIFCLLQHFKHDNTLLLKEIVDMLTKNIFDASKL
jgi:WD40 repeat protein